MDTEKKGKASAIKQQQCQSDVYVPKLLCWIDNINKHGNSWQWTLMKHQIGLTKPAEKEAFCYNFNFAVVVDVAAVASLLQIKTITYVSVK